MTGLRPAAWLSLHDPKAPAVECEKRVAQFLGADLFQRADVDLNAYYVLAMDDAPSISVVDPLFGFGGSKLLAMVPLESPGADWVQSTDRLFVAMPKANKLAVADTHDWKLVTNVSTGPKPRRVLMGANRAWVADARGLTAVDVKTLAVSSIQLGDVVDIALSDDRNQVFATGAQRVTIVDTRDARVQGHVALEGTPTRLDYSRAAKAVYALDAQAGRVYAIDARTRTLRSEIAVRPGATQLRFAPDGRHALLPNPRENVVQVLDAASDRVVQNIAIDDAPDRVSFTDLLAYVRRRQSEIVPMIALSQIGTEGAAVGVADFPGGQHTLAGGSDEADSIVAAPDAPAVLVANPADRMIYYYKEGMAAPAGGFSTYGRAPRAVMVVDRGLRESARGHYTTTAPIKRGGAYDVTMFVDAPRVAACFTAAVDVPTTPAPAPLRVVAIDPPDHLAHGRSARLRFAIRRNDTSPSADDVRGLVFEAPGVWQHRDEAKRQPDGSYAFDFVPPEAGTYYVWIESESLGLSRHNSQFQIYRVD